MLKTTEDFIREAKLVHGDKYDYSETEYIGANKKVKIICPEHGAFWQRASSHLSGCGCKKCSYENRDLGMTTEEFIERARKVHGDKYDYTKTVYKGSLEDVIVTYPDHGDFKTNPSRHINKGCGCTECFLEGRRMKFDEFLKKAKEKHGDKYDYSQANFVDMNTPITIICPEHGAFTQKPKDHLHSGCIRCGGKWHKTREEFIEAAIKIHGDKYSYEKVDYVNSKTKVIITCKDHGDFLATPSMILQGQGCPTCKRYKARGKKVCGIGINDYDGVIKRNEIRESFYQTWRDMLKRCYVNCYDETNKRDMSYRDCIVCNDWIYASKFAEYFFDEKNGYRDGYNIDKDLFAKDGKKLYSPETCCFVPPMINSLISKQKQNRGKYPIGVTKGKCNKFYSNVSNPITKKQEFIGSYDTVQEAFEAYRKRKREIIKEVAEMFYSKGEITERVYKRLLDYDIDIND